MWGVTKLHARVTSAQSRSTLHWTQVSLLPSPATSQTGVAVPTQALAFVASHWTQVWLVVSHAGEPVTVVQFASLVHATHVFVARLHAGVAPEHCALLRHATHVFVARLHAGVVPEHCALLTHWTHVVADVPVQTPPVHGAPARANPQVPVAHVLQAPAHALLQQTLPTHSLLVHWSAAPHAALRPPFATHVPAAGPVVAQ